MRPLLVSLTCLCLGAPLTAQAPQPVVFVHGLLGTGNDWPTLESYIKANFYVQTITPTLGWNQTYESQGLAFHNAFLGAGFDTSVAISHSNGSIVTRQYIVDRGATGRVNRHLSIGGLHEGAELADQVRNGDVGLWILQVANFVADPILFYLAHDTALVGTDVAAVLQDVRDFVNFFFDAATSGYILTWKLAVALGFDPAVPVLEQMEPGSATFQALNSSSGLAAEAAATTAEGRVSIGTRTNPDLLPWSNFMSRASAADTRTVMRIGAYLGAFLYYYYLGHKDPLLSANAGKWLQMYWALELIPVSWANQIGALSIFGWNPYEPGNYFAPIAPNDGVLTVATQEYEGGTRAIVLTPPDVLHLEQRFHPDVRDEVGLVLRGDFKVPGAPPPPPLGVSVALTGPSQMQRGAASQFTAAASGGGGGYTYNWFVAEAGAPMSYAGAGSGLSATFNVCGQALVRVEVTAADSSGAADEQPVAVMCPVLSVSISGPTAIKPTASCTWIASVTNGVAPFSYEWRRNGALVGTANAYSGGMDGAPSFDLALRVADDAGSVATEGITITDNGLNPCLT